MGNALGSGRNLYYDLLITPIFRDYYKNLTYAAGKPKNHHARGCGVTCLILKKIYLAPAGIVNQHQQPPRFFAI